MNPPDDFEFLHHAWTVSHRRLATRLVGAEDWYAFSGTSVTRPVMGGFGNVEDNFLDDPNGAYHATALRSFDAQTGEWRIWWLDLRHPGKIDPPVIGRFESDRGIFIGEDSWQGQPIQVRFLWLCDAGRGPRWEQAFSADSGHSWETNWVMDFARRTDPGES